MMRTKARARRGAFTFIELLFVIAIIALLIALFLGAVNKVMQLQARTEILSDITKMQQSLGAARHKYTDVDFLPGKIVLFNDVSKYTTNLGTVPVAQRPLAQQSAPVLRAMFGKRFLTNPHPAWDGSTLATRPTSVWWGAQASTPVGLTLEGSECLVFYLGGMPEWQTGPPASAKCVGFSSNPQNPTIPPALQTAAERADRNGPFYEFRSNRLVPVNANPNVNPFVRHLDSYGTPFVYFGATSPNNYDPTHAHLGVDPYAEAGSNPTKWLNPNTFQIISAGKNRAFGPGGNWAVAQGYSSASPGADDLSNFTQTELGNPQE